MNRRHHAVTLQQASAESPTLAMLTALTRDSSDRLEAIEPLIPPGLRGTLQAGPIDGTSWCLLVSSNSAAAKLRQMMPAMKLALEHKGLAVGQLRIKVQQASWR